MKHQNLISLMESYGPMSLSDKQLILEYFKPISYPKSSILLNEGQACKQLFFVSKGILRAYYHNDKAKEITRSIMVENGFMTNMLSFKSNEPNTEIIETLSTVDLLVINRQDFECLINESSGLKDIYIHLLEEYNAQRTKHLHQISAYTIAQKFNYLSSNFSHLIPLLSDRILASFLGISREYYVKNKKLLYAEL